MASSRSTNTVPPVVVDADVDRKILRVSFRGLIEPGHVHAQLQRLKDLLPTLGSGFTLVTDLSGLDGMELDCAVHVSRIMDLCLAAGLSKVIRVIPDPRKDIGFNVLSILHYRGQVPTVICKTQAEANAELSR